MVRIMPSLDMPSGYEELVSESTSRNEKAF